jgi:MHS family proline/betaine transporter-like MFS transporter
MPIGFNARPSMPKSPAQTSLARVVLAGLIGNVMEWYDFAVYGYFASVIGRLFFPASDPAVSLIASFGAFAAGFLVRPLGGLIFGRIGDLVGRQRALTLSVMAMALPTVGMACLPTYDTLGVAAPIALVALRIVQGLSVGGEFTSSLIFLVEHAPHNRRAFTAVWGSWGASAGILLGSGVGVLMNALLEDQQLTDWGWRIPFALGGLVALTGYLVRCGLQVSGPVGRSLAPVREVFGQYRGSVLRVALLNLGFGVSFYAAFIYAVSYVRDIDRLPEGIALRLNTWAMSLLLVVLPAAAWLSDRFGRKPVLVTAFTLLAAGAVPLFQLIHSAEATLILYGEVGFALLVGLVSGGVVATNVELIPAPVRCTGLAFAYNASIGYFGGSTPLIAAALIKATQNPIAPAYWIAATAVVSLFTALFFVHETRLQPLS